MMNASRRHKATVTSVDDDRKWLMRNLRLLEEKMLTKDLKILCNGELMKAIQECDANAVNSLGESLLIAVVKYLDDVEDRLKYLRLLLESGANINFQEPRDKRTALMHACIENDRTDAGLHLLKSKSCNLQLQDRLGNTAIMHAAMKGRNDLMSAMVDALSKTWCLNVLQLTNCVGYTAEELAIRNGHHKCARLVQSQRLHMVSCLNRQMDMMGRVGCRHWCAFAALYKCVDKWKTRPRRRSEESRKLLKVPAQLPRKKSM